MTPLPILILLKRRLSAWFTKRRLKSIATYSDESARQSLKNMLILTAELSDCSVIIRGKRYYGAAPDDIGPDLLGYTYLIPQKHSKKMLIAEKCRRS